MTAILRSTLMKTLRGWPVVTISAVGLLICNGAPVSQSKEKLVVREVGLIRIPDCPEYGLEDAANGLLLLGCEEGAYKDNLFVWNVSEGRVSKRIPLNWWPELKSRMSRPFADFGPGPFRLLGPEGRLAGIAGCRGVIVDGQRVQQLEAPADICDPASPFFKERCNTHKVVLAIDDERRNVAIAFNVGAKPRLLLFHGDCERPYVVKEVPRYVMDVAWTPDDKKVAVLDSGVIDLQLQCRAFDPRAHLTLPDIAVFDARSGTRELSFFSGGPEAKLEFSRDGRLIYCISHTKALGYFWGDWGKETLKVFSAADGRLSKTLRVARSGVRNGFALSPDGRLIAADASTDLFRFLQEPDFMNKMGRFVILDSESGERLFEYHASMEGRSHSPVGFAFSPDGRFLFVDFNGEGVITYSIG